MKKVDLWASSDSDDSLFGKTAMGKDERNGDFYKKLYSSEMKKRIELEEMVALQKSEIDALKAQLALYKGNSLDHPLSDPEDDDLFSEPLPKAKAAIPLKPAVPAPIVAAPVQSAPPSLADPHWDELAQAERERRSKVRRNKVTKSIRLPLQAAVQQIGQNQQARTDAKPLSRSTSLENLAAAADQAAPAPAPAASTESAQDADDLQSGSIPDGDGKDQKFKNKKRSVRHGGNTGLKRLNAKSLPRDLASLSIKSNASGTSETRPVSVDSAPRLDVFADSDSEDGWDSTDDRAPSPVPAPAASPVPVPVPVVSSLSKITAVTSPPYDSAEVEAMMIGWARGKHLAQLLNTVRDIAPSGTFPEYPVLPLSAGPEDVRRIYLRIVRCCHPDKLVTNKALSSRDHAILAKMFTVLSDAYSAYSQMLS